MAWKSAASSSESVFIWIICIPGVECRVYESIRQGRRPLRLRHRRCIRASSLAAYTEVGKRLFERRIEVLSGLLRSFAADLGQW